MDDHEWRLLKQRTTPFYGARHYEAAAARALSSLRRNHRMCHRFIQRLRQQAKLERQRQLWHQQHIERGLGLEQVVAEADPP